MGVAVYFGSRLLAQQQPQAQPQYPCIIPASPTTGAARTHVCLINVGQVIKNYKKFQNFEADLKAQQETALKAVEDKKAAVTAWEAELRKPETTTARREELEKGIKQTQRQVQDYLDECKQKWSKSEFDTLVQIFKEVHEAAQRYAQVRDIDLVLQYNDPVSADYFLPAFFTRKLNNQACMPMVMAAGMDITVPITEMLNGRLASYPSAGHPNGN
jgi:Skp family chaperone for outer membrane proteins